MKRIEIAVPKGWKINEKESNEEKIVFTKIEPKVSTSWEEHVQRFPQDKNVTRPISQLRALMLEWNNNWTPEPRKFVYGIYFDREGEPKFSPQSYKSLLYFKTPELAQGFIDCFRNLLKELYNWF